MDCTDRPLAGWAVYTKLKHMDFIPLVRPPCPRGIVFTAAIPFGIIPALPTYHPDSAGVFYYDTGWYGPQGLVWYDTAWGGLHRWELIYAII